MRVANLKIGARPCRKENSCAGTPIKAIATARNNTEDQCEQC